MKKIKEGLINEEIVRRYPGSNNGGNNIVDKGKGSGPRSHDYGALAHSRFCEYSDYFTKIYVLIYKIILYFHFNIIEK